MMLFALVPDINEKHTALGFLPSRIRRLASELERIFLFTTNYDKDTPLPENVEVHCIPEDRSKIVKFYHLNRILLINTLKSDVIFCFMYPIFAIWVAAYARLFRKPIVMWYAHGSVSKRMRIAHFLATRAVTSSKDGFRIKSRKLSIIGQGIDTSKFKRKAKKRSEKKTILYLGRISLVKGIEDIIKAANVLVNNYGIKDIEFSIIGAITDESQKPYYESLKELISSFKLTNYFKFIGAIPYSKIERYYQECDLFINPSNTGSLDKVVLEAMSCGKIVITSNEAYYNVLDEDMRSKCYFPPGNYEELAEKIRTNLLYPDNELKSRLKNLVVTDHSLDLWVKKLMEVFKEVRRK